MSQFKSSYAKTKGELAVLFKRWEVGEAWDIEEGYSGRRTSNLAPHERRIKVWWQDKHGRRREVACDHYALKDDNLRAIYLTLEAYRKIDYWGLGALAAQTFAMLESGRRSPHDVLGLIEGADKAVIEKRYKQLAKETHPDTVGGDAERFKEITAAYEELTK